MSVTNTDPIAPQGPSDLGQVPARQQPSEQPPITVPGMDEATSRQTIEILERRLASLLDLQLTLKHIHWNVVGANFIAIHEFLDPQVDSVRKMTDATAERIATLGGEPRGTPGAIVELRTWADYDLRREPAIKHLSELDRVYGGIIRDHRQAAEQLADLDLVSQDLLIGHLHDLEQYQWFVRAHLQNSAGEVIFRDTEH